MNKEQTKFTIITCLISTIIILILHNLNLLIYNKYFLLPIIIQIISYLYLLKKHNMVINKKGYIYLIPIILIITGTILLKTDISNKLLNIIIIPILISFLFFSLTNYNYQLSNSFYKWFLKLFPGKIFTNLNKINENIKLQDTNKKNISNILIGIAISIPFIIVILTLLTSADMYFNAFIGKITNYFSFFLDLEKIRNNLLVFIIYFILLFSIFINIINNKKTTIENKEIKSINTSIANTVLIMINLVFTLFIISEVSKLTTNFLSIPETYTYAEYAREGFFQLLFVTIINFSIIIYFLYKTNAIKNNKLLKKLILLLISFTIILIFNSYYRMFLYMHQFGFTILRTQVILFLLMELILLIIIIKKILSNLKHKDANIFMWIIITTYIINIFICNSNIIDLINNLIGY